MRLRLIPLWLVMAWLLPVSLAQSQPSRLATIRSFVVYYGTNQAFAKQLSQFDLAIVQPNTLSYPQRRKLQAQGTRVVAYLSVGEAEGYMVGLPKAWVLGTNPNWGSKYMDANQAGWREAVLQRAKDILEIGFDGLFLDTVDTVDLFPKTKPGMVQLIRALRQSFPKAILVQNRGFAVLPQTAPFLDAVMFEDFSTLYNFNDGTYQAHEGDPRPLFPYLKRGLKVLALDYALPTQTALIQRAYSRARRYGFVPYVTTISLNEVSPAPGSR